MADIEQPDALDPAAVLKKAGREPWEATTSDYQPPGYPSAIVQHEAGGRRTDVVAPNVRSLSDATAIVHAVNTWAAREAWIAALERADRTNIVRLQEMVEEQDAREARIAALERTVGQDMLDELDARLEAQTKLRNAEEKIAALVCEQRAYHADKEEMAARLATLEAELAYEKEACAALHEQWDAECIRRDRLEAQLAQARAVMDLAIGSDERSHRDAPRADCITCRLIHVRDQIAARALESGRKVKDG